MIEELSVRDWSRRAKADGITRMPKLTSSRVLSACENDDGAGICIYCGADAEDYCEPDARNYTCTSCGEDAVFGAQEIALQVAF